MSTDVLMHSWGRSRDCNAMWPRLALSSHGDSADFRISEGHVPNEGVALTTGAVAAPHGSFLATHTSELEQTNG